MKMDAGIMMKMNDLGIVIAAGGSSSRFGTENKLFVVLGSKPVFIHSLLEFTAVVPAENIVITVPEALIAVFSEEIQREAACCGVRVVAGGETRTRSVKNGMDALPEGLSYVAIHDAARPLVTNALLAECYLMAQKHKAAIPGKRVNDTLKRVECDGRIAETVDRSDLVAVETPQVFDLRALTGAYELAGLDGVEATDDAGIMEHAGHAPHIVISETLNLKITYSDDVLIARAYYSARCN